MTEHLPECPILKPCCDDEEFPEHGFCGNFVGRCLHCMAECMCDALRACEAAPAERDEEAAVARYFEATGLFEPAAIETLVSPGLGVDPLYAVWATRGQS